MTNSMKDLLLGLGFKPAPQQDVPVARARDAHKRLPHRDVPMSRAQDAQERPTQPVSKPERSDASRHQPSRRDAHQRKPEQRIGQPAQDKREGQGARPEHGAHRPRHAQPPRTREEIDLAKAYAIRAQKEKDERIEAERLKQDAARIKREAKAKVAELLKDKSLNAADAELTRHFDYNGKIRRIHVTDAQLKSLNAGELGVVQLDGRYLLVDAEAARQVRDLLPSLLALLVDPDAPAVDDPYADPKYVVPDDLVW
jgi:uncharacterized protein YaiL (DUF2058 family)